MVRWSENIGVVTAVKGAVAVVIAWVAADKVIGSPEAFLAPYAALFIIGNTVRNSMRVAARQVSVVVLGVLVAAVAVAALPEVAALAVATAAGIVVGRLPPLAPDGVWVAVTAALVLLYGTATNPLLVAHRIGDVTLGVCVGIAVNAVVVPPDHLADARDLLLARACEVSDILRHLAEGVRSRSDDGNEWRRRVLAMHTSAAAETVLTEGEESLVGNFRKRGWLRNGGPHTLRPVAEALDRTMMHLVRLVLAVEDYVVDEDAARRDSVIELLEMVAESFACAGADPARVPIDNDVATALTGARERLAEFESLVRQGREPSIASSSIVFSSRGLIEALSVVERADHRAPSEN